ncbi:MAG: glycosyl transferase [Bradyrhizobium sp.]|nr:glycosyl transferase [Bradyrhizobium sp.]
MTRLGIVIIGRNEGERLVRCLRSIGTEAETVYVDSGSSDNSVAQARAANARVVELDMARPFTAARARNAGRAALSPDCELIQFVDGDCSLQPGWLKAGAASFLADHKLAAVFGRRREIAPEFSRYNWMCDIEWAVSPGPARYFGGDVMLRAAALDDAGGYPDEMIAGEEPDLAIRMRDKGWKILCLPVEMTLHDAAISRFGQWWRRAQRSGHAFAELAARHQGSALQDYTRRMQGVLFWATVLPTIGLALLLGALLWKDGRIAALAVVVLLLPLAQLARLALRETRRRPLGEALTLAAFLMLAKPAQSLGIARYWRGRLGGTPARIIEYKSNPA